MSGLTVAVAVAVLAGSLAQSVSGLGFSLVSGPLLVTVLGAADGVRLGVALSLVVNVVLLVRYRAGVDRRGTLLLFVPTALALPVWARLLRAVPPRPAAALAGATIVLGVLLVAAGLRWRAARGRVGAVVTGVVAAGTTVVASVSGPPVALWAANAGWSARTQRASLQAYFLGVNLVALPTLGLPRVPPSLLLVCLAAMAAGLLLGAPLSHRVSEPVGRRTTLTLAAAGGLAVLGAALRP